MSRIEQRFSALKAEGRTALVPFMTAGDPHPGQTVAMMHALVEGGADIIELGVPFSDPMADGPVIQRASERALEFHVSLHDVLGMVSEFRKQDNDTPVVLMGYLNPIEVMGYQAFAQAAHEAGVDGALTVDLPPEEGHEWLGIARAADVDPIFLLAPTSDEARIAQICEAASGFVYYVSVKGITGAGHLDTQAVADKLNIIRKHTQLPVGVGFGIKDGATAAQVGAEADAVIVGSALVSRIEAIGNQPEALLNEIKGFISELRQALDAS